MRELALWGGPWKPQDVPLLLPFLWLFTFSSIHAGFIAWSITSLVLMGVCIPVISQQARIALVEGKPDARQQLEQVAKDYPKDSVGMEANMRLEVASLPPATTPQTPAQPARKPAATANKGKK